jgi:hypothetical protein
MELKKEIDMLNKQSLMLKCKHLLLKRPTKKQTASKKERDAKKRQQEAWKSTFLKLFKMKLLHQGFQMFHPPNKSCRY